MHELSLAVSAVELCLESAGDKKVTQVTIEKGAFCGVDTHAFYFAWPEAIKNTSMSAAKLELVEEIGRLVCHGCNHEFDSFDLITLCPRCENFDLGIIKGREFKVLSLEVEDVS